MNNSTNNLIFNIFYFYPDPKGNGKEGYILNDINFSNNYLHDIDINYKENLDLFTSFLCQAVGFSILFLIRFFDSINENILLVNTNKNINFIPVSADRFFTESEKEFLKNFHINKDLSLYGTNVNQMLKNEADIKKILERSTLHYIDSNYNCDINVKEHNILFVDDGNKKFNDENCLTFFYKENVINNTIEVCLAISDDEKHTDMEYIIYSNKKIHYIILSQIDIETLQASLIYENSDFNNDYNENVKKAVAEETFHKITEDKIKDLNTLYLKLKKID